ncbi:MAG: hypothetical protein IJU44_08475 [Kiritimatiellae bacterium]|nr:hypothetical protein [Kiritimatiellia bacterium]
MFRLKLFLPLAFAAVSTVCGKPLPEVTDAAKEAMGTTPGRMVLTGFVFVDGKYLPPPYTVSRIGNGIFVNRVQVEQPVPWTHFYPPKADEKNDDDDFEEVDDNGGKADNAKPANGDFEEVPETPAAPAAPQKNAAAKVDDLDDLFADDDPPPANKPAAKPDAAPAAPQPARDIADEIERLKAALDKARATYENRLAKNDIYFFSTSHSRINGNYGTARSMLEVLPEALYAATSAEDLFARLRRANIYFLDERAVRVIFKNKQSYPMLKERRQRIRQQEALEAAKRKREREASRGNY